MPCVPPSGPWVTGGGRSMSTPRTEMSDGAASAHTAMVESLDRAAVPQDAVVIVHSAFRGLGRQGWQPEMVISALMERLAKGTVLMPTMTWRTVTPEAPLFDELLTPSHTGVLGEIFRQRYAQARSLHPTHSIAGWGRDLGYLLGGHHQGCTPCPEDSPFGRMRERPSFVMLLGVGMESCTAIHFIEERIAPDVYLEPAEQMVAYTLRDRHGTTHVMKLRRHLRLPRDFNQFAVTLRAKSAISEGTFGDVGWSVFPISALYREVELALLADVRAIT